MVVFLYIFLPNTKQIPNSFQDVFASLISCFTLFFCFLYSFYFSSLLFQILLPLLVIGLTCSSISSFQYNVCLLFLVIVTVLQMYFLPLNIFFLRNSHIRQIFHSTVLWSCIKAFTLSFNFRIVRQFLLLVCGVFSFPLHSYL